jgi:hypothetical protein
MLFDLRSRRRRGAVKVIYLSLAVVMVVGLVGLGIGTGSTGGLLNAGGNGSSGNGNSVNTQQVKNAIKAVKKNPSAANWAALMSARYAAAGTGNDYNSNTGTYSAAGKKQLQQGADAWQQYLTASGNKPSLNNAILAARMYENLSQWADEAVAWNYAAQSAPAAERVTPLYCLALSAYAAKQKSKGDLAAAQALALTTKAQRLTQKSALQAAKSSASTAQQGAASC